MTIPTPETATTQTIPGSEGAHDTIARVAHEFVEVIRNEGNVHVVFGEPMELDNHKFVPVARVEIGFGGGLGSGSDGNGLARRIGSLAQVVRRGFGAGGGGSIKIIPIGFIHEDGERVRYHAIPDGEERRSKTRRM
jgi:uncharacterized spore protein YtfJ